MADNTATLQRFTGLASRIKGIEDFVLGEVKRIVDSEKEWLEEKNRQYMAEEGQRPDGREIQARGYSRAYAEYKVEFGRFKNVSYVDLKFSGDFHESIRIKVKSETKLSITYEYVSGDSKKEELETRYGNLLGVRQEDLNEFMFQRVYRQLLSSIQGYLR